MGDTTHKTSRMKNLVLKTRFLLKRPVVLVAGKKELSFRLAKFISQKTEREVFVLPLKKISPFLVSSAGKTVFLAEKEESLKKVKLLTRESASLVYREELERKVKGIGAKKSFGFEETADVSCLDLKQNRKATNFKVSFEGKIMPVWLKGRWSREEVYSVLAVLAASLEAGLNIVHVSRALKDFDKKKK